MKILVVDDDPVTRLTIERLLTSRGCEVVCAADGEEAYVLLKSPNAPKLAIVDWMMPRLSGPELCRKLRVSGTAGRIHIIMVTGNRANTDVVTGLEAGGRRLYDEAVQRGRIVRSGPCRGTSYQRAGATAASSHER